ncbi:uncharacterized protein LOC132759705 [Ruditapes philippinarum]|uniref:uncharacterized protein LOC132759705 n=1 Tax=Ruditapes philippinarum TaxID=129788 RepID=UPI00295B6627|nr:uncharacterized protein LOC132759705 [Ruditapes philippinarum]
MGNPSAERFNWTLLRMLGTVAEDHKSKWADFVPSLVQAYNATKNSSTGFSSHFLMFGWHPRLSVDAFLGTFPSNSEHLSPPTYVSRLKERLQYAYRLAGDVSKKGLIKTRSNMTLEFERNMLLPFISIPEEDADSPVETKPNQNLDVFLYRKTSSSVQIEESNSSSDSETASSSVQIEESNSSSDSETASSSVQIEESNSSSDSETASSSVQIEESNSSSDSETASSSVQSEESNSSPDSETASISVQIEEINSSSDSETASSSVQIEESNLSSDSETTSSSVQIEESNLSSDSETASSSVQIEESNSSPDSETASSSVQLEESNLSPDSETASSSVQIEESNLSSDSETASSSVQIEESNSSPDSETASSLVQLEESNLSPDSETASSSVQIEESYSSPDSETTSSSVPNVEETNDEDFYGFHGLGDLQLYRVLREDESIENGIFCQNKNSNRTVAQHIASGSKYKSKFISTTSSLDVARYWAYFEMDTRERKAKKVPSKIVEIDIKVLAGTNYEKNCINLCDEEVRNHFIKGAIHRNYAKSSREVLFVEQIPKKAIRLKEDISRPNTPSPKKEKKRKKERQRFGC